MEEYRVLYDFIAEEEGEISVRVGEILYPVYDTDESIPEGWMMIETSDDHERGLVPSDYLEKLPASSSTSSPPSNPPPAPVEDISSPPPPPDNNNGSSSTTVSSSSPGISASKKNAFAAAMAQKQAASTPSAATPSNTNSNTGGKSSVVANAFLAAAKKSDASRSTSSSNSSTASSTPAVAATPNPAPVQPQAPAVAPSTAAAKAFINAARATPAPAPAPVASTPFARPPTAPTPAPQSTPASSYASQGISSSTNPLASPPPSAAAGTPKTAGFSKLKAAAKSVQSMVHVSSAVATPRVPSLASAVEREDFDELVKRNDEYFARLLASQADTFTSLTDMVDALAKKLNESTQASGDLVAKLTELDDLIDEEKRKWKLQNENEKNADILERSKELAQAAIRA